MIFHVQGGYRALSGYCSLKARIRGRNLAYRGLLTFRAPDDLPIELSATPAASTLRVGAVGFRMDPLRIEGLKPDAFSRSDNVAMTLIRDYFGAVSLR